MCCSQDEIQERVMVGRKTKRFNFTFISLYTSTKSTEHCLSLVVHQSIKPKKAPKDLKVPELEIIFE